jgi:hypothetical protein
MKESRRDGMRFAPGNGWVKDEELEHLKRELAQVKQERDIFKKRYHPASWPFHLKDTKTK